MVARKPDARMLIQFKCIEKLKWTMSERAKKDVGLDAAGMSWVVDGFAAKFAEVYDEDLTVKEIYERTVGDNG